MNDLICKVKSFLEDRLAHIGHKAVWGYDILKEPEIKSTHNTASKESKSFTVSGRRLEKFIADNYPDYLDKIRFFDNRVIVAGPTEEDKHEAFKYVEEIFQCCEYFKSLTMSDDDAIHLNSFIKDLNFLYHKSEAIFAKNRTLHSVRDGAMLVFYYRYDRTKNRVPNCDTNSLESEVMKHAWKLPYNREVAYHDGKPVYSKGHSVEVLSLMHQIFSQVGDYSNKRIINSIHLPLIGMNEEGKINYLRNKLRSVRSFTEDLDVLLESISP